jgi:hypothetical protein
VEKASTRGGKVVEKENIDPDILIKRDFWFQGLLV